LSEKEICYKIYCEAFGDDEFSINLFENFYQYCKSYKVCDEIVAIMFLFPCKIFCKEKSYAANYVFAVTTAKTYRGKGYMSDFIKKISNETICFLKPANESLIDFYKSKGYKSFYAIKSREGEKYVKPCDDFLRLAEKYTEFNNQQYIAMYRYKEELNLNGLSFAYTME